MDDRERIRSLLSRLPRFEDLKPRFQDYFQVRKLRCSDFEQKLQHHLSKLGVPELEAFVVFQPISQISFFGSGGFAKVYKVKVDGDEDYYAAKEILEEMVAEVSYKDSFR